MRARIASQDGIVMPTVTGVMLVMSMLVATLFMASNSVSDSSLEDRNTKNALAAAEAGLQVAVYRLNQIRNPAVPPNQCLTTAPVAPTGTPAECPGHTEQIGNGARYTYWVTPHLGTTGTCVQIPGRPTAVTDRCITVAGTSGGVTRRVQVRVDTQNANTVYPFAVAGLVGKSLVEARNSVKMFTNVGSNVHVNFQNSIDVYDEIQAGSVFLWAGPPPGSYTYQNSVDVEGGTHTVATPFEVPIVDYEAVENLNDNDQLPAAVFNPTTRHLVVPAQGVVTIPPGDYHVCRVFLDNHVDLRFSHTGNMPTRIYVDSPSRTGSVCAGQPDPAGTFGVANNVDVNKEVGEREELLEIHMYGTGKEDTRAAFSWCGSNSPGQDAECKSDFMIDNSAVFYGMVIAPNSTVGARNNAVIWGGVSADKIRFYQQVEFHVTAQVTGKGITTGGGGPASRRGWTECARSPSAANDPESGC